MVPMSALAPAWFVFASDAELIALSGGSLDPEGTQVREALAHALARTRAAGKRIGIFSHTGRRTRELAQQGFDLITLSSDAALLRTGAQAELAQARAT